MMKALRPYQGCILDLLVAKNVTVKADRPEKL
jgi:hypothetical protein